MGSSRWSITGWLGAALAAVLVCGVAWLKLPVRSSPDENRPAQPELVAIPEPAWGSDDLAARRHVTEFRNALDQIQFAESPSSDALAAAYGALGEIYLAYDLPVSAVPCFQNAGQLGPREYRWPYLRAMALFGMTETAAAAAAMQDAVPLMLADRTVPQEHLAAAWCFLGEAALRLNQTEDARNCFDEALALAPELRFARFKRGQLLALQGDSEAALGDLLKAWTLSPEPKPAAIGLAIAAEYRKLGRSADAERYLPLATPGAKDAVISFPNPLLRQVLALNQRPSSVQANAEAELSRGRLPQALELVERGLAYSPDAIDLRRLRARILLALNQPSAAIAELNSLPSEARRDDATREALIQASLRIPDKSDHALTEAQSWLDDQPAALRPRMVLAAVLFELKQYPAAAEQFAAAAELAPHESAARLGEIDSRCAAGDYAAALRCLEAALAELPQDAELRHHFARFLATCPKPEFRDAERGKNLIADLMSTAIAPRLRETQACVLAAAGTFSEARSVLFEQLRDRRTPQSLPVERRINRMLDSFAAEQIWTEPWPFAELDNSR